MRFRLGYWELEVNRPNGRERAARTCRLCACGAVEDELHVFMECPAYDSLRARYGSDLGFQGHSMRTIMTEAPQLALASFLSEIWETRHVALRRTVLKRTTEGDDDLPGHHKKSEQLSMGPPALTDSPALVRNL
jgi:hypothetical protein